MIGETSTKVGPHVPCDEALLKALLMKEMEDQAEVVEAFVNEWPYWYGASGIWWDAFEKREEDAHEHVPLLAIAARHANVLAFDYISTKVIRADGASAFFLQGHLSSVSPLREAIVAGRTDIVRYLLERTTDSNHWCHIVGLAGCNCVQAHCR